MCASAQYSAFFIRMMKSMTGELNSMFILCITDPPLNTIDGWNIFCNLHGLLSVFVLPFELAVSGSDL